MKKFLALAGMVAFLAFSQNAFAQSGRWKTADPVERGFGIVGGVTLSNVHTQGWKSDMKCRGRGGVAYKFSFGNGFAVQPELVFNERSIRLHYDMAETTILKMSVENGYIELPVQVQWGPEIPVGRVFFFAEPFIGVGINGYASVVHQPVYNKWKECNMRRFEYGTGLGVGYEIWHVQLSAQYSTNFGGLAKDPSYENKPDDPSDPYFEIKETVAHTLKNHNFGAFYFTMGFFF